MIQADLFENVCSVLASTESVSNKALYRSVVRMSGLPDAILEEKHPVGRDNAPVSLIKRKIRWHQQTLKKLGLISRADRGYWQLTAEGKRKLKKANPKVSMLAFSTELGIAIWGACEHVFASLDAPITLCVTSPPYPLRQARAYGNVAESEYVDFICRAIEPIVKNLVRGGNICINVGNDIFERGSPARSLYRERMVLALCDRFGLHKMDELVWENRSKPPGPLQWASLSRQQLNVSWEPVYWFTNDPAHCKADNRRVLQEHTSRHLELIKTGGEKRTAKFCDGAYSIRHGSFSNETAGKIPKNVLSYGHNCADQRAYKKFCDENQLPKHGAPMPLSLAKFLVRFMSEEGDLVCDPFGGSLTTAKAAEALGRRWVSTDLMAEYLYGAATRFTSAEGFSMNNGFAEVLAG